MKPKKYLTEIPHQGGNRDFQYPAFKGEYGDVAEQIDNDGLERPTSAETGSLVHDAFQNLKGESESEIIKILEDAWLCEFTGNLYLPKGKGDILQDNPLIINRKLVMNKNDLIEKLYDAEEFRIKGNPIFISKDRLVRFVPFGYKTGEQTWQELAVNPNIVARYLGRKNHELEGAEKIAEVASKYKKNPHLNSFNSVDEEQIRISALDSWGFSGGLDVYGSGWCVGDDGRAFGVCKDTEKSK